MGGVNSGRKPEPTALKAIKGVRKSRINRQEPRPTGKLGDPPEEFTEQERAMWFETAGELCPGVAANSDRVGFELLVRLRTKLRHEFNTKAGMSGAEMAQLVNLCGRFGLTPADRARLQVADSDKPQDPLETVRSARTSNEIVQ